MVKSRPNPGSASGAVRPQAIVIIYHQRTGIVSHTHYFSTAGGGQLPDRSELERVAYAHAEQDGCNVGMHRALHVDPTALKRGVGYRVSVAKRALVEVKAGRQAPRSAGA